MSEIQQPKITIVNPEKDIQSAIKLIDKFLKLNNLKIRYHIKVDHGLKENCYGIFYPDKGNEIHINPSYKSETKESKLQGRGYVYDFSLTLICVHEMAHLMDERLDLISDYKKTFKDRIIINKNCESHKYEELAELLSLYIMNPFLLRHINKDVYQYWQSKFWSPTRTSQASFIRLWRDWNKEVREDCFKRWGIKVSRGKVLI